MYAAKGGDATIVKMLLEKGAELEAKNLVRERARLLAFSWLSFVHLLGLLLAA